MVSRLRPLARLRLSTLRPSCVDILLRNPCRLFPLRLERFFKCFFIARNYNIVCCLVKIFPQQSLAAGRKLLDLESVTCQAAHSRRENSLRGKGKASRPGGSAKAGSSLFRAGKAFLAKIAVALWFLFAIIGTLFCP